MTRVNVIIPARLDSVGIVNILNQFSSFENLFDEEIELTIDGKWLSFVYPDSLLVLLGSILKFRLMNPKAEIGFNLPENDNVKTYLARMDFFEKLGVKYNETFKRREKSGRFVEIKELTTEESCSIYAEEISDIFKTQYSLTKQQYAALLTSIAEIAENTFHHSKSQIHGYVAAQYYPNDKVIRIAICDFGVGIESALLFSGFYKKMNSEEALKTAIKYKTTSRPDHNSGYGLYVVTELIRRSDGIFSIHSHTGKLMGRNGRLLFSDVPKWHGTLVNLEFKSNIAFNVDDIYNEMRKPNDILETVDYLESRWK